MRRTIAAMLIGISVGGLSAIPTTLHAQSGAALSPLTVAGQWSGGVTMVDFTDAPYCEWSGTLVLDLQQNGNAITGKATTEFAKARRLRDVNLPCNPYPARDDDVTGTVSGSRIEFDIRTAKYSGRLTSDLMKGSFAAGALNRGGVRGCFQLSQRGAIAACSP
jgi:hypothetical protein